MNERIIKGFIVTKEIEKSKGYFKVMYNVERIKKVGYSNRPMIALRTEDIIELIKADNKRNIEFK